MSPSTHRLKRGSFALMFLTACSCDATDPGTSVKRQAGSWKMDQVITAFDASGVTGDMAEMVKGGQASIGKKEDSDPVCLSAEDVAGDTLTTRLSEAAQFGPEWKVARKEIKDGTVDFEARMDDPAQGKGVMKIVGSITPTLTSLVLTTEGTVSRGGKIRTEMRRENKRVGDC